MDISDLFRWLWPRRRNQIGSDWSGTSADPESSVLSIGPRRTEL